MNMGNRTSTVHSWISCLEHVFSILKFFDEYMITNDYVFLFWSFMFVGQKKLWTLNDKHEAWSSQDGLLANFHLYIFGTN